MAWNIRIVILLYVGAVSVSAEPCDTNEYTVISDNERAANLQLDLTTTNPFTDDRLTDGWYRVQNDVGEEMATSPPGSFNCTTWHPIWLNGTLPSAINTTVTAPVCIQTFQSLCGHTWNIEIKRCPGNYLVYNLKASPLIDSGYCFGWAVPCPEGLTGWSPNCKNATTTTSTTASPTTARSTTTSPTTARSTTTSPTTARSTTTSSTTADGHVRGGEHKEKDEGEGQGYFKVVIIAAAIVMVICVGLIVIYMVRNKMNQSRCNTEERENKKNLYQETTKEYKYNKENEHLYSIPVWTTHPEDSPPPYSSRPTSATHVGWTGNQLSSPVYNLFTVEKK